MQFTDNELTCMTNTVLRKVSLLFMELCIIAPPFKSAFVRRNDVSLSLSLKDIGITFSGMVLNLNVDAEINWDAKYNDRGIRFFLLRFYVRKKSYACHHSQ
jgi:hypothetical protein